MPNTDEDPHEELLRLREENLRLREKQVEERERQSSGRTPILQAKPATINVNQVNESALSGCFGLISVVVVGFMVLAQCSH